jgi:hypothetical protein
LSKRHETTVGIGSRTAIMQPSCTVIAIDPPWTNVVRTECRRIEAGEAGDVMFEAAAHAVFAKTGIEAVDAAHPRREAAA